MHRMFKFEIPFPSDDFVTVHVPNRAVVRHFGRDPRGVLCVWAEVDPGERLIATEFKIIGTGHEVPHDGRYIGSVLQGPFIWHCYQRIVIPTG